MTTLKEIAIKYPYMFSNKKGFGVSIPFGWKSIFFTLCDDLDKLLGDDKKGFYWSQCGEKFGAPRWRWNMKGVKPSVHVNLIEPGGYTTFSTKEKSKSLDVDPIAKLIGDAEKQALDSCIVCGKACSMHVDSTGWYMQLCQEHSVMRDDRHLPQIWGDDDFIAAPK